MMFKLELGELLKMARLVQSIIETNSSAKAPDSPPTLQVLSLHQMSGDLDLHVSHKKDIKEMMLKSIKEMLKSLQFS